MIVSPVRGNYPITQVFWEHPENYAKFDMKGHNGEDISIPEGTPIYSPIDGITYVGSDPAGYGNYIFVTSMPIQQDGTARQVIMGHFSNIIIWSGVNVKAGDILGYSGNTWNSTGPHLHWGIRRVKWNWWSPDVMDVTNGYFWYIDIFRKWWILENIISQY